MSDTSSRAMSPAWPVPRTLSTIIWARGKRQFGRKKGGPRGGGREREREGVTEYSYSEIKFMKSDFYLCFDQILRAIVQN